MDCNRCIVALACAVLFSSSLWCMDMVFVCGVLCLIVLTRYERGCVSVLLRLAVVSKKGKILSEKASDRQTFASVRRSRPCQLNAPLQHRAVRPARAEQETLRKAHTTQRDEERILYPKPRLPRQSHLIRGKPHGLHVRAVPAKAVPRVGRLAHWIPAPTASTIALLEPSSAHGVSQGRT